MTTALALIRLDPILGVISTSVAPYFNIISLTQLSWGPTWGLHIEQLAVLRDQQCMSTFQPFTTLMCYQHINSFKLWPWITESELQSMFCYHKEVLTRALCPGRRLGEAKMLTMLLISYISELLHIKQRSCMWGTKQECCTVYIIHTQILFNQGNVLHNQNSSFRNSDEHKESRYHCVANKNKF